MLIGGAHRCPHTCGRGMHEANWLAAIIAGVTLQGERLQIVLQRQRMLGAGLGECSSAGLGNIGVPSAAPGLAASLLRAPEWAPVPLSMPLTTCTPAICGC